MSEALESYDRDKEDFIRTGTDFTAERTLSDMHGTPSSRGGGIGESLSRGFGHWWRDMISSGRGDNLYGDEGGDEVVRGDRLADSNYGMFKKRARIDGYHEKNERHTRRNQEREEDRRKKKKGRRQRPEDEEEIWD
eukprot:GHVQ01003832.1.p1 GENE.GHVQ01003832.1~~GHVQ01003832.1.p1  ORF type:complete len:136 (+),score=31.16 GHVQ01003832.1:134-541(+)